MTTGQLACALGLFAVVVLLMPFAVIWALNTLFLLTIPTNFATWAAALLLSGLVAGSGVSRS